MNQHKFKKEERLKSRKLITGLFENGKIIHAYPFKILYNFSNYKEQTSPVQMGVSVSKRNFKTAVARNRIKRKIREAYRLNKHALYQNLGSYNQKLHLFVIYTTKIDEDYQAIEKGIHAMIRKIHQKEQKA